MKKVVYKISMFIISTVIMISCGDEQVFFKSIEPVEGSNAKVKFIHAASDTTGVNWFLDEQKVTSGVLVGTETAPSVVAYAVVFPAVDYSTVSSGSYPLKVIVPDKKVGTTQYLKKTMVTTSLNADDQKYYTIAFAGVTGSYETVVIEDAMGAIPLDGQSYVRFVNLIHNSAELLDVEATKVTSPASTPLLIADNVAYKSSTTFAALAPGNYTLKLLNGTTSANYPPSATASNIAVTLVGNKVYTFYSRGQVGLPLSDAKRPLLSTATNR
jgi:hypothetical protein